MIKQILGRLPKKPSKSDNSNNSTPSSNHANASNDVGATSNATSAGRCGSLPSYNNINGSREGGHISNNNGSGGGAVALWPNAGKRMSSVVFPTNGTAYEPLASFREVPTSERQNLFISKLNMCCVVFYFSNPSKNAREKEIKRQTLLELVDYITSGSAKFSEPVMEEITRMVTINLFRTPPPSPHENTGGMEGFDPEDEEPTMEPAWSHLQIVYEFLLIFVASTETDAKIAKRYVDHSFILRLLDLFDLEDPLEREYLKTILHRIYGKFMVHRPFIRKAINNIFYQFVLEIERHNGIEELLEILGSIINAFAFPLKEEHKLFLVRALISLHKPKCVSMYHQQLSYCITQFVEKDFKLADMVIRGLLKYWLVTNSQKEVMFFGELEEVLEATQAAEFQRCMVPLFRQIGHCLNSSHFQLAADVGNSCVMESLCHAKLSNVQTIQKDTRRKHLQDEIQKQSQTINNNILREAHRQQKEIDIERDEEAGLASTKKAFSLVIEEAKSDSDEDDFDGFSKTQSQYDGYEEVPEEDEKVLAAFMFDSVVPQRTLADLIIERIRKKNAAVSSNI